ncbi:MAG: hypothetical protein KatS3mg014_0970 [Actinomycetota bacterium]|nr:MAG: hypothetical protein KatS3mg014_0970 [Actinomycetota bacterium]
MPALAARVADRLRLGLAGAVEVELPRVPAVLDPRAGGDHARDPEVAREGPDDLLRRRAHDEHEAGVAPVLGDEVEGLLVHVGVDHVHDHVADEPLDLGPVPALRELEQPFLQPLHLPLVRPHERVHELRVRAPQELPPRDHPRPVHRPREREGGRAGDDRLVEIEEGRLHRRSILGEPGDEVWHPREPAGGGLSAGPRRRPGPDHPATAARPRRAPPGARGGAERGRSPGRRPRRAAHAPPRSGPGDPPGPRPELR